MKAMALTCLVLLARMPGCTMEPTPDDAGPPPMGDAGDPSLTSLDAGTPPTDAGTPPADAAPDPPVVGGPMVHIHLRVATEPAAHPAGTSGQTPTRHRAGMRSFYLLRDADDPEPLHVFDFGDGFVEVGYEPGDDTVVASVPIRGLTRGLYTVGRVVHTHADYTVDTTMHAYGYDLPGQIDHLVAMSDRTTLDGAERARGWYRLLFRSGGLEIPREGGGFDVPALPSGGFGVHIEDGEHAYYFPVSLQVEPELPGDVHMVMEVNMHESFRWEDQDGPGHARGIFDTNPAGWEPVRQFGANSFRVYMDPAP